MRSRKQHGQILRIGDRWYLRYRERRAVGGTIEPKARLECHRLRCGDPQSGPVFANTLGNPLNMNNFLGRVILPSLNRCAACKSEEDHSNANHQYKRDERIPRRHGWHAARRGIGSNLYRVGVPDIVIQRILRHANVSTSGTYYTKTAANDGRSAVAKLESMIATVEKPPNAQWDTNRTLKSETAEAPASVS